MVDVPNITDGYEASGFELNFSNEKSGIQRGIQEYTGTISRLGQWVDDIRSGESTTFIPSLMNTDITDDNSSANPSSNESNNFFNLTDTFSQTISFVRNFFFPQSLQREEATKTGRSSSAAGSKNRSGYLSKIFSTLSSISTIQLIIDFYNNSMAQLKRREREDAKVREKEFNEAREEEARLARIQEQHNIETAQAKARYDEELRLQHLRERT